MKQTPILFSTPMVQGILEGRKTQTRRIIKHQPTIDPQTGDWLVKGLAGNEEVHPIEDWVKLQPKDCPYGQPGDILWVRETWAPFTAVIRVPRDYHYKASKDANLNGGKWKPSIHMPKAAARIWLEVVSVKVERLTDITEEDAIAEGIEGSAEEGYESYEIVHEGKHKGKPSPHSIFNNRLAKFSFTELWESINGVGSWQANPWVWVIEFKRVENPNNNIEKLNK